MFSREVFILKYNKRNLNSFNFEAGEYSRKVILKPKVSLNEEDLVQIITICRHHIFFPPPRQTNQPLQNLNLKRSLLATRKPFLGLLSNVSRATVFLLGPHGAIPYQDHAHVDSQAAVCQRQALHQIALRGFGQ
jgi:hypothetical protein